MPTEKQLRMAPRFDPPHENRLFMNAAPAVQPPGLVLFVELPYSVG